MKVLLFSIHTFHDKLSELLEENQHFILSNNEKEHVKRVSDRVRQVNESQLQDEASRSLTAEVVHENEQEAEEEAEEEPEEPEEEEEEEEKPRGRGARKKKKVVQEEVYDFEEEADSEDDGRRKSSKKGRNSVGARESAKKSKGRPSRGEASSAKKGKVPTLKIKLGGRSGKRSKNASSDEEDEEQANGAAEDSDAEFEEIIAISGYVRNKGRSDYEIEKILRARGLYPIAD